MSLFLCTHCGCIANTATDGYWRQRMDAKPAEKPLTDVRCSVCDPNGPGVWHGSFPRRVPAPECVQPNVLGGLFVDIVGDVHDVARCMCATCAKERGDT